MRAFLFDLETMQSSKVVAIQRLSANFPRDGVRNNRGSARFTEALSLYLFELENCRLFTRRFSHFRHGSLDAPLFPSYADDKRSEARYPRRIPCQRLACPRLVKKQYPTDTNKHCTVIARRKKKATELKIGKRARVFFFF